MLTDFAKNRTTEKDIRSWLGVNGYEGQPQQIFDVELHAVKRPGWLQIFRFRAVIGPATDQCEYFGVVRDDESVRGKDKTQIWLYESEEVQRQALADLSEELIVQGDRAPSYLLLLVLLGILFLIIIGGLVNLLS